MKSFANFDSLERHEIWVRWRRKIYAVVVNSIRNLLARYRFWFPSVITLRGIKVSNQRAHVSDEAFSALILGLYERSEFACLPHLDRVSGPILELGGSSGIISCALSQRLAPTRHIIVEAHSKLVPTLEYHLSLNRVEQCTILNRAVVASEAEKISCVRFDSVASSLAGRVERGDMTEDTNSIPGVTLRSLYNEQIKEGKFMLFCDIEGMEVDCLFHPEAHEVLTRINQAVIEFHAVTRNGTMILAEQSAKKFAAVTGMKACFRHGDVWLFKLQQT